MSGTYEYGLWGLVAFHIGVFLLFGLGLLQPAEPFAHAAGNLWATLLLGPWAAGLLMGLGGVMIIAGVALIISGWRSIHSASGLVTDGIYATIRHPQYAGIGITIVGALIQWPTLLTLLMAPVLLASYVRLARKEERELEARFGEAYRAYRERVPAFMPAWQRRVEA